MTTQLELEIIDRLEECGDQPAVMVDRMVEHFRTQRRPMELFESLKMRTRFRLGLPLIASPDEPRQADDVDRQLEAGLLEACSEVGELLIAQGEVRAGWMYLRPTGDIQRASELLATVEPNDENTEELIEVLLHEGVDIGRGFRLLLDRNGTCNSITTYEQAIVNRGKRDRQAAAEALLDHFYRELVDSVRGDISRHEAPARAEESLAEMLQSRKWILSDGGYHLDTTHLSSVVRISRVLSERDHLEKAWELTQYGRRLSHSFQYPGEEPFVDFYPAHATYFATLLGRDVDAGLAMFERRARSVDPLQHGTEAIEVYVDLLDRCDRGVQAVDAAVEMVPDQVPSPRLVPLLLEIASRCEHYQPILDYCRRHGDVIGYAATRIAAHPLAR